MSHQFCLGMCGRILTIDEEKDGLCQKCKGKVHTDIICVSCKVHTVQRTFEDGRICLDCGTIQEKK